MFFRKWPPVALYRISYHFRSIPQFLWSFFTKWLPSAILDVRKSLSISFLSISHRYATFNFLDFFWQNGCRRPFWMSEIHFWSHFWPFPMDRTFWISERPFLMSENHFGSHVWPFQIHTELFFEFFWQNGRRRPFWMGRQCQLSNSSEIFGWVMHVSSLKNVV